LIRRMNGSTFLEAWAVEGLALLVIGRVPWEPELLDPWKAAWDRLIWKAMIPKVKAIEGELNRNQLAFMLGRSQTCCGDADAAAEAPPRLTSSPGFANTK